MEPPDIGFEPRWNSLLRSAWFLAERAEQPDEERARQLASMACWAIPAAAACFRPEHARMAFDLVDELFWRRETRRKIEKDRALGGSSWCPTLNEVRLYLEEFAAQACSPV